MTEFAEQNPEVWEKWFPNPEQRRRNRNIVDKVSRVVGVEKILASVLESFPDGPRLLTYVVSNEHSLLRVTRDLSQAILDIAEEGGKPLLPDVYSEKQFREMELMEQLPGLPKIKSDVIWQRQQEYPQA